MKIMIMGGTSDLGLALAAHYAAQGAQLALCGRDISRLARHPLGSDVRVCTYQFDIADQIALTAAVREFGQGGLDLLIVTAGQYADGAALAAEPALGLRLLQTNIAGLVHAFDAAAVQMRAQGYGQMVAVASIAGLLKDYPRGSLYSATKRAAIGICDSYRKALEPFEITVTTIVPGYVDTARLRELNGGDASGKPFLLSEIAAVERITPAIARREARCVFPRQLHMLPRLFNQLPLGLRQVRCK